MNIMVNKGCGKKLDALGYIKCGDEIYENSIPQGRYLKCKDCKNKDEPRFRLSIRKR